MSKHLKRLNAPRSWVLPRKTNVYTTKPRAGPHAIARSIPLSTVLRDYLGLAASGREARTAIGGGDVLVDGRVVKDAKLAVGFMDVVSVPKLKRARRSSTCTTVATCSSRRTTTRPAMSCAWTCPARRSPATSPSLRVSRS